MIYKGYNCKEYHNYKVKSYGLCFDKDEVFNCGTCGKSLYRRIEYTDDHKTNYMNLSYFIIVSDRKERSQ